MDNSIFMRDLIGLCSDIGNWKGREADLLRVIAAGPAASELSTSYAGSTDVAAPAEAAAEPPAEEPPPAEREQTVAEGAEEPFQVLQEVEQNDAPAEAASPGAPGEDARSDATSVPEASEMPMSPPAVVATDGEHPPAFAEESTGVRDKVVEPAEQVG